MSDIVSGIIAFVAIAALCGVFWLRIWRRKFLPSIAAGLTTAVIVMALAYVASGSITPMAIPIFATLAVAAFGIALVLELLIGRKPKAAQLTESEEVPWRKDLRRIGLDLLVGAVFVVVMLSLGQALKNGDILLIGLLLIASFLVLRVRKWISTRFPSPKNGVEQGTRQTGDKSGAV